MSRPSFTLLETVTVILVIGIIAAVAAPAFTDRQYQARVANIQASLRSIQSQVDLYFAANGSYPTTINPQWFEGNRIPRHPLNDDEIAHIHVFDDDDRVHPGHKTLDRYGAYWYNKNIGVVRARVPYSKNASEIVATYNLLNGTSISNKGQRYD